MLAGLFSLGHHTLCGHHSQYRSHDIFFTANHPVFFFCMGMVPIEHLLRKDYVMLQLYLRFCHIAFDDVSDTRNNG